MNDCKLARKTTDNKCEVRKNQRKKKHICFIVVIRADLYVHVEMQK